MKEITNIYRAARMRAAERKGIFSNRYRAAEVLFISAEALDDYENGRTIPSCDRVQRMVEVYGDPDLRVQHIRQCCPLMDEHMSEGSSELSLAACGWGLAFTSTNNIQEAAIKFLEIARDGRLGPDEADSAREVRAQAILISQLMQETITAIDKGLNLLKNQHGKERRP